MRRVCPDWCPRAGRLLGDVVARAAPRAAEVSGRAHDLAGRAVVPEVDRDALDELARHDRVSSLRG